MKTHEWFEKELKEARGRVGFRVEQDALEFTEQISELMERQGLNKSGLAKILDTSRAYVTKVMSGACNQNLTLKTMERFVMALGANLTIKVEAVANSYIFNEPSEPNNSICRTLPLFPVPSVGAMVPSGFARKAPSEEASPGMSLAFKTREEKGESADVEDYSFAEGF